VNLQKFSFVSNFEEKFCC